MWFSFGVILYLWGSRLLDKYPFLLFVPLFFEILPFIAFYLLTQGYSVAPNGLSYTVCIERVNDVCITQQTRYFMDRNTTLYALELIQLFVIGDFKFAILMIGVAYAVVRFIQDLNVIRL